MFKRKCYDKLLEWKRESNGRSAVLVEGARRVGKTTLVREFAEHEYADHIYIDFSKAPKVVLDLFRNEREDVDTFLRMLQLQYVKDMPVRESVIIFDEVQRFPMAREYIKHLVADGRFDYIETGSLISIRKSVGDIVIPSEEDRLQLHPFDFDEYLWAMGAGVYVDAIGKEKRTLRKGAFCAGTLTERRILDQRRHGKAHPALRTLRATICVSPCRTLRVPRYAPLPCALLGMHCDLGDDASDPSRSRYPTPAGYTSHRGNSMVYCLDVWARSIVLLLGGHTRWRALALTCSDLF